MVFSGALMRPRQFFHVLGGAPRGCATIANTLRTNIDRHPNHVILECDISNERVQLPAARRLPAVRGGDAAGAWDAANI